MASKYHIYGSLHNGGRVQAVQSQ